MGLLVDVADATPCYESYSKFNMCLFCLDPPYREMKKDYGVRRVSFSNVACKILAIVDKVLIASCGEV